MPNTAPKGLPAVVNEIKQVLGQVAQLKLYPELQPYLDQIRQGEELFAGMAQEVMRSMAFNPQTSTPQEVLGQQMQAPGMNPNAPGFSQGMMDQTQGAAAQQGLMPPQGMPPPGMMG